MRCCLHKVHMQDTYFLFLLGGWRGKAVEWSSEEVQEERAAGRERRREMLAGYGKEET